MLKIRDLRSLCPSVRVSSASRLCEAEAIYAAPDAIYYFYLPAGLYVDRHWARASDLESAVKASIDEMKDNLQRHKMIEIKSHSSPGLKAMGSVGQDFSCPWPPTSPICPPSKNKIVSISRKEGNWILVLRRRYDQELIIDSAKKFVSTRKLSEGEIGEK